MRKLNLLGITLLFLLLSACNHHSGSDIQETATESQTQNKTGVSLVVLGTVQDAGSPHIACKKECCELLFTFPDPLRKVVSLGIIDYDSDKSFVIEASPDFPVQLKMIKSRTNNEEKEIPDGIFLTHAHIGHYTGLMYLGREATNANMVPVYVMPRMKNFLETNGPWNQLVSLKNIELNEMNADSTVQLTLNLKIIPFLVPHRDEYSETVGYLIKGAEKSAAFIPDIDKWEKWDRSITDLIQSVDYAFLDATFYSGDELNTRDISEIPHPFIIESMELFDTLSTEEKKKIHFIHFNHTNPVLKSSSEETKLVRKAGFNISQLGDEIKL